MKSRETIVWIAVPLATLALALVGAELFLHSFRPVSYREPPPRTPEREWRELVHRPSDVPGLLYELAPNVESESKSTIVRTNSHGMRDREPLAAGDRVVRILDR
jgi:hypothetical protein